MAKRRRESDSDGTTPQTAVYNTVFVDTSLDTHLAMLVSNSDTVSDFKGKMVLEHMQCFPEVGEINIHSLKVKRKGKLYHLPDIILVCSAFHGVKGDWFLLAETSSNVMGYQNQKSSELDTLDSLKMVVCNSRGLSPVVNRISTPKVTSLLNNRTENHGVSDMIAGLIVEKPSEKTADVEGNGYSVENSTNSDSCAKKNLKVKHNEDVCHNLTMEDDDTLFDKPGKNISPADMVDCGNSAVDALKQAQEVMLNFEQQGKPIMSEAIAEISGFRDGEPDIDDRIAFGETAANKNDHTKSESFVPGINMSGKSENELRQNVPTDLPEGVAINESNVSVKSIDNDDVMQYPKSDGKKKRKNRKKTAAKTQDASSLDHETAKGGSLEGTHIAAAAEKGNSGSIIDSQELLSSDRRKEDSITANVIPENRIAGKSENEFGRNDQTDCSEFVIAKEQNISARSTDSSGTMQDVKSDGKKKRRRAKKSAANVQDLSDVKHETPKGGSIEDTHIVAEAEKDSLGSIVDSLELLASVRREEDSMMANVIPENSIAGKSETGNDQADPSEFVTVKEQKILARLIDSSSAMQDVKSSNGKKKRKKAKKSADKVHDSSNMEHEAGKGRTTQGINMLMEAEKGVMDSENLLVSDNRKEDKVLESGFPESLTGASENELCHNLPTEHLEGMTVNESVRSAIVVDTDGTTGDPKFDQGKRNKRRGHMADANMQDASYMEHEIKRGEFLEPRTETYKSEKREESQLSILDNKVSMSSYGKISENVDTDLMSKETNSTPGANVVVEPEISTGIRKRRKKMSGGTNMEKSGSEQTHADIMSSSVFLCSSADHISKETGKAESILDARNEEILMKSSDTSTAGEKAGHATESNANFVISQIDRTGEDVGSAKGKTSDADFPAVVNVNQTEFNQAQKNSEGRRNKSRKSKKKRKKSQPTASDVQEDVPIKDQKVDVGTHVNVENLTSFVSSEPQCRPVASSHLTPHKSEELLEGMHESTVNGDAEGINFKQYFLPDRPEDKVASRDTVKKATKSSDEMKTGKHNEVHAASSWTREKNTSLAKSSSERSETYPSKQRDKTQQPVLNVNSNWVMKTPVQKSLFTRSGTIFQDYSRTGTDKMMARTRQKKSLLAKPGSIFQANSGEDSENENVPFDSSTRSPSDSTSVSGDSEGESDFSQNSTRNGSVDGKSMSKLEDLTMEMILRSSNQFKRAKLQASQNEVEEMEFVPDSLPNP